MTRRFLLSTILIAIFGTSLYGQVEGLDSDWTQFGHSSGWTRSKNPIANQDTIHIAWNVKIGDGRSQVVGTSDDVFVLTGEASKVGDVTKLSTRVSNLDLISGKEKWAYDFDSVMSPDQETFGGAPATPQATPVIAADRLIAVSFSGQLICLDRNNGDLVWEKDLVKELGADAVQFGFASSPVVDSSQPDRVFVLAAGEAGGLYCLKASDGSTLWKSELSSASYATPTSAEFGGVKQWVVVSENEVVGVSKSDGKRLWRYPLPAAEMTNVPSPLVFDNQRLVIAGQGSEGARCLTITRKSELWNVEEKWYQRKLQFFYTNWLKLDDQTVVGCIDQYLAAIRIDDGKILGRWRGFSDGNVMLAGAELLVLDGKGKLNVLELSKKNSQVVGFNATGKFNLLNQRCWTPVSIVNNRLLIRGGDRLVCITTKATPDATSKENLANGDTLEFEVGSAAEAPNPVEMIFAKFESQGQEAALTLYQKLRSDQLLNEAARIELAEAAQEQSLTDVAKRIITEAVKDFPDSKEIKSVAGIILGK